MTQPEIYIYSTPTCGFCRTEKAYLKGKGFSYTEYDAAFDPDRAVELIQKSGQRGVPVTIIKHDNREDIIVGFDRPKIDQLLGIGTTTSNPTPPPNSTSLSWE